MVYTFIQPSHWTLLIYGNKKITPFNYIVSIEILLLTLKDVIKLYYHKG